VINTEKKLPMSNKEKDFVHLMSILGDNTRYKMFKIMLQKQELCVSEMADELGVSNSAISQHFRLFEMAGMVIKKREGQKICHVLNSENDMLVKLSKIIRS
jgi:DNA-binding transcriptional ArsR family regulator